MLFTTSVVLKIATPTVLEITNNGNFLFYNSPVFAQLNNSLFVAFVTTNGKVQVKKYRLDKHNRQLTPGQQVDVWEVHDYSETINWQNGFSDDHAAPSIIYNAKINKLLLATSYQAKDLYIYQFDFSKNDFILYKKINGCFTYPRMINCDDDIVLVLRDQPNCSDNGDLICRKYSDGFGSSNTIVYSLSGEVVFGSRPDVCGNHLYVTYSTLDYSNGRLIGWNIVKYNLDALDVTNSFDLKNHLDYNYHSNRPTAIRIVNNNIMVGTTVTFSPAVAENYVQENKILILTLDSSGNLIKVNQVDTVKAPYYPASIDINPSGDWVYFDKTKLCCSANLDVSWFRRYINMYPNFWGRNILFATRNKKNYKIRDFDMSIRLYSERRGE